jgi:hypothetical protein
MVAYSFKERFIAPISVGLGLLPSEPKIVDDFGYDYKIVEAIRPKRQTIRAIGGKRHAHPGEILQLYYGMRTKQCRQIGVARCRSVEGVLFKWSEWQSFLTYEIMQDEIGYWRRTGPTQEIKNRDQFAVDDGFADFSEMSEFWMKEHGDLTFEGLLIKWEPIHG